MRAAGHCTGLRAWCLGLCWIAVAAFGNPSPAQKDPLEAARAALRTLKYDQAIALLERAGNAGNAEAQYLLGLIYLNGVGVLPDAPRARALLQSAAEHGQGAAAYVLAAQLANTDPADVGAAQEWLERSASLGYARASDTLKSGRPLLAREGFSQNDHAMLVAWVIDRARHNDADELRRLGADAAQVRDEFGRSALLHATELGALAAAQALLTLGADVAAADQFGTTALMLAVERPDTQLAQLLLQHGADPKVVDAEHRTAIFYAARANRSAAIELLQHAASSSLDAHDSRGYTALDAANAVGADAAARQLRALGAQATVQSTVMGPQNGKFDASRPGEIYRGWQALALAVSRNDAATVRQLLDAGALANLRLAQGDTLLQVAADSHALECMALLLARGADASLADHAGHSALWLAATRHDEPLIKALLNGGVKADAHAAHEDTPLLAAVRAGLAGSVQLLLEAGANVEATDELGRTPLMIAAADTNHLLVPLILPHRPKLSAQDHELRTALWHAAWSGSRDSVEALLAAGADPEPVDAQGFTALHAAAAHGQPGVVALLLSGNTRLNIRSTSTGDTPLLLAAASGREEAVSALLGKSPELDLQNRAGDTALIAASRGGYTNICHALLARGANRSLRNGARVSAADVAGGRGFSALAKELAKT
jgi:ankyrin repeat protein